MTARTFLVLSVLGGSTLLGGSAAAFNWGAEAPVEERVSLRQESSTGRSFFAWHARSHVGGGLSRGK